MSAATAPRRTIPIAQILGMEDIEVPREERVKQSPSGRWWIRPAVKILGEDGETQWFRGKRRYMESRTKRKAQAQANKILRGLESEKVVLQSQIPFGDFLDYYLQNWVRLPECLAASTAAKYGNHIKNHIRPAFGALAMCEITTRRIDGFLRSKTTLSWAAKTDLKNLLSAIFTRARKWGWWQEINPAQDAYVGRKKAVREKVKLTVQQTAQLLAALKLDVRLICMAALFCGLRISEVLGLQWRDVDWDAGRFRIRRRFYRGDLDELKSTKARRDVPMGYLVDELKRMGPGDPEAFIFSVATHEGEFKPRVSRDDRDINQHFLRPAAKALGLYRPGFGFHSLRREAVTEYQATLGQAQAQRLAGHSKADMTQEYTLPDLEKQDRAVRQFQERVLGRAEGDVQ